MARALNKTQARVLRVNDKRRTSFGWIAGLCGLVMLTLFSGFAHATDEYRLGAGDRIRLNVSNRPDLSRELLVQIDGSIVLERTGRIAAAGNTASELERTVTERLAKTGGALNGEVAIEIVAYRPFFVVGNVTSPGLYAYQPDMNVLVAVALAGGIRVPQANDVSIRLEGARIEERIALLKLQIGDTLIRRERVLAELAGNESFGVPAEAVKYIVEELAEKTLAGEKTVMASRRTSRASELRLLNGQLDQVVSELGSIDSQNKSALARLDAFERERAKLKPLFDKGLVISNRDFDLERSILSATGDLSSLRAASARARREQLGVERELEGQKNGLKLENETALREMTTQMATLLTQLDEARVQLVRADRLSAELESRTGERKAPGSFLIMRREKGQSAIFEAKLDTPVEPGDIVTVPGGISPDGPTPKVSLDATAAKTP